MFGISRIQERFHNGSVFRSDGSPYGATMQAFAPSRSLAEPMRAMLSFNVNALPVPLPRQVPKAVQMGV